MSLRFCFARDSANLETLEMCFTYDPAQLQTWTVAKSRRNKNRRKDTKLEAEYTIPNRL
jgi:hypothetical protein